jgi:hypothetical protein
MSYKQVPRTQVVGIHKAPVELTYSQQPQQDVETIINRTSASQYLVLDSKNRFFSASPNQTQDQPWNNFRLQKGESLMESFATRLTISEIRFPWLIPNITTFNDTIYIVGVVVGDTVNTVHEIGLISQFYTPDEIMTEINNQISTFNLINPPTFSSLVAGETEVNLATSGGSPIWISWRPVDLTAPSLTPQQIQDLKYQYATLPSLAKTLGFTFEQVLYSPNTGAGGPDFFPILNTIVSNPTEYLYTSYVDITSNKLNQYTTNLDGSSDITSNRLLLRLYYSDESSMYNSYNNENNIINIYNPTLIHRQFKNPKQVMWNKESVVDWLDIQVRDQYGNLVYLPQIQLAGNDPNADPPFTTTIEGSYPDFQITLLATEN